MATQLIGGRIKALREERKLSQNDLARLFGFKDRQTVSAIETGERRVTAEELMLASKSWGHRWTTLPTPSYWLARAVSPGGKTTLAQSA